MNEWLEARQTIAASCWQSHHRLGYWPALHWSKLGEAKLVWWTNWLIIITIIVDRLLKMMAQSWSFRRELWRNRRPADYSYYSHRASFHWFFQVHFSSSTVCRKQFDPLFQNLRTFAYWVGAGCLGQEYPLMCHFGVLHGRLPNFWPILIAALWIAQIDRFQRKCKIGQVDFCWSQNCCY